MNVMLRQRHWPLYERHGFRAVAFSDEAANKARCPDVLYELSRHASELISLKPKTLT
jgi:hypothetical protein